MHASADPYCSRFMHTFAALEHCAHSENERSGFASSVGHPFRFPPPRAPSRDTPHIEQTGGGLSSSIKAAASSGDGSFLSLTASLPSPTASLPSPTAPPPRSAAHRLLSHDPRHRLLDCRCRLHCRFRCQLRRCRLNEQPTSQRRVQLQQAREAHHPELADRRRRGGVCQLAASLHARGRGQLARSGRVAPILELVIRNLLSWSRRVSSLTASVATISVAPPPAPLVAAAAVLGFFFFFDRFLRPSSSISLSISLSESCSIRISTVSTFSFSGFRRSFSRPGART